MTRCIAAGLISLGCLVSPGQAQEPEFETTRIAEGAYQFRYRSHNGLFVVTDAGLIAIDPISVAAAEHYAAEMKRVAPDSPLLAIVYSHDHADHATGATVLRRAFDSDAPVIAHEKAHAKVAAVGDPDLPAPDLTFSKELTLYFGGRALELHYRGPSHSDNMLVAYLPDVKLAFAVDFVSNDRMGYRDLPDYHFPEFFAALDRLLEIPFETIVFGHGPAGDRGSVIRQVGYYRDLRNAVREAVGRGWTEDEAAERIRLPAYEDWGQYEAWFPMNVRAIYRWLASEQGG
jgi:glyoxylase-like metal-dependent hydrolase (beta-lactamase superfamily II)